MNYLISNKGRSRGDSVNGKPYNNSDEVCFVNITALPPIQTVVTRGTQMHLMLTVSDTWCEKAYSGVWFGIKVSIKVGDKVYDKVVTKGLYTTAVDGQRIPITLQALFEAPTDGFVTIQAVWCNWPNTGPCYIGTWGDAQLIAGIEDHELDARKLKELLGKIPGLNMKNILSKG